MEVTIKGEKHQVGRIVDLPKQKKIKVVIPGLDQPPLVLEGEDYGTGLLAKNAAEFKTLVEEKLNA